MTTTAKNGRSEKEKELDKSQMLRYLALLIGKYLDTDGADEGTAATLLKLGRGLIDEI